MGRGNNSSSEAENTIVGKGGALLAESPTEG